jgi:hypothetical protein
MAKRIKFVNRKNTNTSEIDYVTNSIEIFVDDANNKRLSFPNYVKNLRSSQINRKESIIEITLIYSSLIFRVDIHPNAKEADLVTVYGYDQKEFAKSFKPSNGVEIFKAPTPVLTTRISFSLLNNLKGTINVFSLRPAKEEGDNLCEYISFNDNKINKLLD